MYNLHRRVEILVTLMKISGGFSNIGCQQLRSHEILLAPNTRFSCQIILTFYRGHGIITAVLWTNVQNELTTKN